MPRRLWAVAVLLLAVDLHAQQSPPQPLFKLEEVMIPVRDGVRLQTVILTPVDRTAPLPILFRRTPYGVPDEPPRQMPATRAAIAARTTRAGRGGPSPPTWERTIPSW